MNKEKLIFSVSIDLGLSKDKSEKTVNAVFDSLLKALKKDGEHVIQKFGRFKLSAGKDNEGKDRIRFIPAKKLALRINSDFKNLKKVKIRKDLNAIEEKFLKYDVRFSITENQNDEITETSGWVNNKSDSGKILISDDLINLHKEITKEVKKKP